MGIVGFIEKLQQIIVASTSWLVVMTVGSFIVWLLLLCCKVKPFSKELKWFLGLPLRNKFIVICVVCLFTLWGGSKERGVLNSGIIEDFSTAMNRIVETIQSRSVPAEVSINAISVTGFEIDIDNCTTYFETCWATNLFDYTDSRSLYLFSSTNLQERRWTPLGALLMPSGTNAYAFTVSSNTVDAGVCSQYLDTFAGTGFYRFGLDFDSDVDGLTDAHESFVFLTNPLNPDTDGDGMNDCWEIYNLRNPIVADMHADTDGDGLCDVDEVGSIKICDTFEWYDLSGCTINQGGELSESLSLYIQDDIELCGEPCHSLHFFDSGIVYLNSFAGGYSWLQYPPIGLSLALYGSSAVAVAPYWSGSYINAADTNSFLRAGNIITNNVCVFEGHNLNIGDGEISYQVIVPHGTGNVIRVSYSDASICLDGSNAVVGVQCTQYERPSGYYNLTWDFERLGNIVPPVTIEYRIGTGTSPLVADTDGDGLTDMEEVSVYHTNPAFADTDFDELNDWDEIQIGTSPFLEDTDGDGLKDGWEVLYGLDPLSGADGDGATGDLDGDGLSNGEEQALETNPTDADTDDDYFSDRAEEIFGTDPTDADTDGDGVWDYAELIYGSNPLDGLECNATNDLVRFEFEFGDSSPSQSEKYRVRIVPVAGEGEEPDIVEFENHEFGECETEIVFLRPLWEYELSIEHLASNLATPDYDYRLVVAGNVSAERLIISDPSGVFGEDYTSTFFGGTGKVATLYVLGRPKLLPDMNRDFVIDAIDEVALTNRNGIVRFWINDDNDIGEVNSGSDIPGSGADGQDDHVNGACDLVDFMPIGVDLSTVFPPSMPESITNRVSWRLRSYAVNALWTGLNYSSAGSFHTNDCGSIFGPQLERQIFDAAIQTNLEAGAEMSNDFLSSITDRNWHGVVLVEGRNASAGLILEGVLDASNSVAAAYLDLRVSSVEDMYRRINSRGLSGECEDFPSALDEPDNRPDSETADRHLVFVHGANVTQSGARGWAAEIFKRMWQSGMTAKFTAVTWRSDKGAEWNYQENVSNAFFTASVIVQQVKNLPGTKVLMAHSLGNMVCSAMIQDYELVPACYLMCNSAVPVEAYDTDMSLRVPQLIHPEWEDYPTNSWASSWHWLFRNDTNDDRRYLGWPGRFSNVAQYAVNFYSTGDEVLELAGNNSVHTWTGISDSWGHYSWHKQELFKGRGGLGGTDWSGWNIDENILGMNKISVAEAHMMAEADFKTNTVFYCYPPSMNSTNIHLLVRGAHLAQGIPALTPAAGWMKFGDTRLRNDSFDCNATIQIARPNEWPERSAYQGQWCHSDLRDVAYFYVFKFYDKVIEKGNLK